MSLLPSHLTGANRAAHASKFKWHVVPQFASACISSLPNGLVGGNLWGDFFENYGPYSNSPILYSCRSCTTLQLGAEDLSKQASFLQPAWDKSSVVSEPLISK